MRTAKHKPTEPDFVTKSELAFHLGADTETIDQWIALGEWPPPHARQGERYSVWLRKHYRQFVETGAWPDEAWRGRKAMEGAR